MISVKAVKKSYRTGNETVQIFDGLDFELQNGTFASIMGPSGSGKSTLLFLMAGIVASDGGTIAIDDTDIGALDDGPMAKFRGKNIAFVFQNFELMPNLTVEENVDLPIDINGIPRRFSTAEILEKVGLSGKWKRYPGELSGGEKQRVAIARAFVGQVPYLFADEPTGNLDRKNADKIMDLMVSLRKETGTAILMITHDGEMAKRSEIRYFLRDGRLVDEKSSVKK
jgi:putative ABC transport system ATP-binding protein